MADNVYKGGLPVDGTDLFPKKSSEGESNEVPGQGGQGRISTKTDESDVTHGAFVTKGDFLEDSSYGTGELSINDDPSMVVRNPDDLSKADSGKMP